MKAVLIALLASTGACAGPSQKQLAETPTATTPKAPSLAPPASDSDEERYRVNESMENMNDAQNAHREAGGESSAPPPAPLPPAPKQ